MVASDGFIRKREGIEARVGIKGHPDLTAYTFVRPDEQGSFHTSITLDVINPGGGINYHCHTDCAPFDHIYYVMTGRIQAKIGDKEEIIGPDSMIYCPSNVSHSIKNIGKEQSKVLRVAAAANGEVSGKLVYL